MISAMRPAQKRIIWAFLCVAIAVIACVTVTLTAFNKPAEYAVSLAGLHDGLEKAVATAKALTAEFNTPVVPSLFTLTVRVRNPSMVLTNCVTRDASVVVSYKGAKVAGGGVPVVCARRGGGEGEISVSMWPWPADLDAAVRLMMPPDGELVRGAVVDVKVTMPRAAVGRHGFYRDFNLDCGSVKVGGGLTLCKSSWS